MGSTFRLKRKLQEQGVDLSSRRATENFCLIGTPLPPLEKSRDTGEYVPLWKQDVRDEKGRRRLHGAFTGGFSAGYFNTVGSAEGWAPKSFVSSRSERAKQKAARPEDYMDEEDLVELRESQVMDKFGKQEGLGGTEAELRKRGAVEEEEDDSLAKSLREALIPAGEDTPGMKLLRKMGWRPGQGVGPRVTWRQRKVQDLLAAGKSLNDIDIDALEDDEEAKKHMYPPRDTVATRHGRKEDKHGLGYVGQLGLQESLGQKRKGPSGPSLSAGFGLGALNEAEEDDIDVYDSSARGERTHMAFDASDPDAEDRFALKRSQARAAGAPRMVSAGLRRFDDGTPIATGFILADKPSFDMRRFPLPEVPAGWKSNPRRVWEKAQGKENVEVADKSKDVAAAWRIKLTPSERGAMLGETPLPSAPRSVFEYLSQKDRERIQHAAATFKAAPSEARPTAEAEVDIHMLPFTPANTAEAALKGFMPFAGDPAKQARYTAYLRSQANPEQRDAAPPRLPGQSAGDYHKEMADFAKSAALFRPVSGAMASRFTSAAVVDAGPQIVEGLHQPVPEAKRTDEERLEAVKEEESRREEEVEGSRGHAVRFGMYGPLTREVRAWQPAKLLCKRFGVKEPEVEVTTETPMPGTAAAAAAGGGWKPEEALAEAGVSVPGPSLVSAGEEGGNGGKKRRDLDNIGLGEDDEQGKDILTYVRPPMDIFKAIFADEESEDEGEEEPTGGVRMKGPQPEPQPEPQPQPEAGPSRAQTGTVPTHLLARTDTNRNAAYEPSSSSSDVNGATPVDLATFKPTFVPRAERDAHKAKDKDRKDRKKKDKDKGVVSFAMEEDGEDGGALHIAPRRKSEKSRDGSKKKKRRKEEMAAESAWDNMWVEKAPPEVVKALDVSGSMMPIPETGERGVEVGPPRGRKRAVDFMED